MPRQGGQGPTRRIGVGGPIVNGFGQNGRDGIVFDRLHKADLHLEHPDIAIEFLQGRRGFLRDLGGQKVFFQRLGHAAGNGIGQVEIDQRQRFGSVAQGRTEGLGHRRRGQRKGQGKSRKTERDFGQGNLGHLGKDGVVIPQPSGPRIRHMT